MLNLKESRNEHLHYHPQDCHSVAAHVDRYRLWRWFTTALADNSVYSTEQKIVSYADLDLFAALADNSVYTTEQKSVSYADLDLSNPAGAQALYDRIKKAASSVCGEIEDTQFEHKVFFRECYDQAVANAVAEANRPTLTALYNSTTAPKG